MRRSPLRQIKCKNYRYDACKVTKNVAVQATPVPLITRFIIRYEKGILAYNLSGQLAEPLSDYRLKVSVRVRAR